VSLGDICQISMMSDEEFSSSKAKCAKFIQVQQNGCKQVYVSPSESSSTQGSLCGSWKSECRYPHLPATGTLGANASKLAQCSPSQTQLEEVGRSVINWWHFHKPPSRFSGHYRHSKRMLVLMTSVTHISYKSKVLHSAVLKASSLVQWEAALYTAMDSANQARLNESDRVD
jgi:hypothetical protein